MRAGWGIAIAVFAIGACKKDPPVEAAPADAGIDASIVAASSVDAGTEAAEAKVPLTAEEKKALTTYAGAMAEGRTATRAKRYADAEEAFDRALAARPDDARARSERGYARLLDGALAKAEDDFNASLRRGIDGKLAAQVFFNIGLLREKKNEMESARSAFAISNALSPTAAAKGKLAGKSGCVADVQIGGSDALEQARDFDELAYKIAPVKDLGSRKASVCIRTHRTDGEPDATDVCKGPLPWVLNHHYLFYTHDVYFVVPQKGSKEGTFFFEAHVGMWPARCQNLPHVSAELTGELLDVTESFTGEWATIDESKPPSSDWQMNCADVLGYDSHAFYDTVTGRRLLRLYVPKLPESGPPPPKISIAGAKITLAGGGCDRTIDLVALRR